MAIKRQLVEDQAASFDSESSDLCCGYSIEHKGSSLVAVPYTIRYGQVFLLLIGSASQVKWRSVRAANQAESLANTVEVAEWSVCSRLALPLNFPLEHFDERQPPRVIITVPSSKPMCPDVYA